MNSLNGLHELACGLIDICEQEGFYSAQGADHCRKDPDAMSAMCEAVEAAILEAVSSKGCSVQDIPFRQDGSMDLQAFCEVFGFGEVEKFKEDFLEKMRLAIKGEIQNKA